MRALLFPKEKAPPLRPPLHLAHEENPYPDQQQHGEPGNKDVHQQRRFLLGLGIDNDARLQEIAHHPRIGRRIGDETPAIRLGALQRAALDGNFGDPALLHFVDEL